MREQANAFRKHRDAEDKQGNLAWASRVGSKALRVSPEAANKDVEGIFELDELEKIIWRLLRLARRYTELEHSGLFDADNLRGVLRGLVAADVVDIVEASEAKALLPAEIRRLKAEVQGKEWRPKVGTLSARVYRPDVDGVTATASSSSSSVGVSAAAPSAPAFEVLLTPEEKRLKEQFLTAAGAMGALNHYQFLGLGQNVEDGAVRAAFVTLARDYHPDKIAGTNLVNDAEARNAVDALFKRLGEAQKAVSTAEARARYDRELALSSTATPGDGKRPRRPVEARNAYLMAETFLKKKDFAQAELHYRQAVMFDPDEPIIQAALAWCIYLNPDTPQDARLADVKKRLEDLLKSARTGDVFYKYGRVLRDLGDDGGALRAFEKAVLLTPGHTDAQREVRLAQARKEKEAQARAEEQTLRGKFNKIFKDR